MVKNFLIAFLGLSAAVMVSFFQQGAFALFSESDAAKLCISRVENDILVVNKVCLQYNLYPKLDTERVLQLVRDKIDHIDKIYDIDNAQIDFQGSSLGSSSIESLDYYKTLYLDKKGIQDVISTLTSPEIAIPLETLAMEQLKTFGIVAANRDISQYGDCATQNFMVGMKAMEHIVVEPGKTWNANKTFSYLSGYCTGSSVQEYMFYQGICGVSSMAFRASMLDPSVKILKRAGHVKRYTKYYGEDVTGDDASIYENIKQFEIQNVSDYPLYIKSKIIGNRPYLVFISPEPLSSKVQLKKEQTGPLSARIERNFMRDGKIITEFWNSEYAVKTEEGN